MATTLTAISGIGPAAEALLKKHGFKTTESIATATPESLSVVPGFGPVRSKNTIEAAQQVIAAGGETASQRPSSEADTVKPASEKQSDKPKNKKTKKTKDKKKDLKKDKPKNKKKKGKDKKSSKQLKKDKSKGKKKKKK